MDTNFCERMSNSIFICDWMVSCWGRSKFAQCIFAQFRRRTGTVIVGEIDKFSYKNEQFYYYFKDCYLQLSKSYIPCNQVLVYMSSDDYSVGQILRIKGKVHIFETATNEGMFDRAKFYQSQKIDFAINDAVVCDVSGNPRMIPKLAYRIKQKLSQVFLEQTGKKKGGLLCGMLLGEKGELELETKTLYQDAGISHVLAISGVQCSIFGIFDSA